MTFDKPRDKVKYDQLDTSKNHPPSPATRLIIAEYGGWQGMVDGPKGVFRDAQLKKNQMKYSSGTDCMIALIR